MPGELGDRLRPLARAIQGAVTLAAIAVGSCLVHRLVLAPSPGEDAAAGFGFDANVPNGVDDWGPADVHNFILQVASAHNNAKDAPGIPRAASAALVRSAQRAEAAEIDGDLLLHIAKDPSGYWKILGLDGKEKAEARVVFSRAIEELRRKTQNAPRDFWEYRSGNREEVFLIEQAVLEQPRTLLWWLTQHKQDSILETFQVADDHRLQFWLMFWLLPNTLLIAEAVRFWESHTYLVSIAVVVGAVNEREQLANRFRRARQSMLGSPAEGLARVPRVVLRVLWNDVLTEAVASAVSASLLYLFWRPVWRCVPWFLCDVDFYYHVTIVPLSKLAVLLRGDPRRDGTAGVQNPIRTGIVQGIRNAIPGSTLRAPEPRPVHWPSPLVIPDDIDSEQDGVPASFICRISHEIMKEPALVSVSGHTYDREQLFTWHANGSGRDPLTQQPFALSDVAPNLAVREMIQKWLDDRQARRKQME
jgi:hypothetical protein